MEKVRKALSLIDFLANPLKDIEIFGMFGPGNLGDEAMLVGALKTLSTKRCTTWQNYANRATLNRLVTSRRRKHLLVAGGTLIHGGKTNWLDYIEMRSQQGAQVSFFGTGIAFTQDQIIKESEPYQRWSAILKHSREIHLRGPHSVEICQRMGAGADVFGDFAFMLHQSNIPVRDHTRRSETIGLNIGNCLGNQELFEDDCVALVKKLSKRHRLVFYIVVNTDIEATRRVINRANIADDNYDVETHYFDPCAFMYSVRNHQAFIGLKLHAAGLAMIAGVPTLMIAYKPKSFDFMAPLIANDRMILRLPLDIDMAISRSDEMIRNPQDFIVENDIAAFASKQRNTLKRVYLKEDQNDA